MSETLSTQHLGSPRGSQRKKHSQMVTKNAGSIFIGESVEVSSSAGGTSFARKMSCGVPQ